ncbi:MAG: hypothetical protein EA353_03310 [Puniceicoccaceae bacterium]|nr:MAG: hypothetical protein EA353_03310 [Puniceicoccaceae bacterium]
MKLLETLEKRFGFLAVPNVVLSIVIAQLFIYAAILVGQVDYASVIFDAQAILRGEWWRLITFLIAPPYLAVTPFQALFLAFYWYIFWMTSQAVESVWGAFRFNVFLLLGLFFSIFGVLLGQLISPAPSLGMTSLAISMSVFFAFATYNPNIQFLLLFVIPVKVKWLAWFAGGFMALSFLFAPSMGYRLLILAPLLNYLIFCRSELTQSLQNRQRQAQFKAAKQAEQAEALHTCTECGATEKSHPERDFRYKVVSNDAICLCEECRLSESDAVTS